MRKNMSPQNVNNSQQLRKKAGVKYIQQRNILFSRMLFLLVFVILVGALISYLFVLDRENKLQKLHTQVSEVKMKNVDIKTQVEFARSLYTIQDKATMFKHLKKPEHVIEINVTGKDLEVDVSDFPSDIQERIVRGY